MENIPQPEKDLLKLQKNFSQLNLYSMGIQEANAFSKELIAAQQTMSYHLFQVCVDALKAERETFAYQTFSLPVEKFYQQAQKHLALGEIKVGLEMVNELINGSFYHTSTSARR